MRQLPLLPLLLSLAFSACSDRQERTADLVPWQAVLVRETGETALDQSIRHAQEQVRNGSQRPEHLEQLAVLFIQKARRAADPGYYKLAEQCARWIESEAPDQAGAHLVRGHVLQSLHRFAEAEPVARELVQARGLFLDHGLLGDVLYDRGKVGEAMASYQRMLDLKPCLQSYSRAAQVRWLRGDLAGARELFELARTSGSVRDPESLAWVNARLAIIALQTDELDLAGKRCEDALALLPDYAAGHHARGLLRTARGELAPAAEDFAAAAASSPLPEHLWALADAQRLLGQTAEAEATEQRLLQSGSREDPRSFSVFLSSRNREGQRALELAQQELGQRSDVFTHDALAWSLFASGRQGEAQAEIRAALNEGTRDGRLLLHAGAIALRAQDRAAAREHLRAAWDLRQALLPSERAQLQHLRELAGSA